ncbi:hypothetical protein AAFF_G00398690 [Aldrovandia affinis]|uniref:Inter-alpha-trypsin inhibitor heavy chain H3-like n=1 Tax=Aldrovandia affinis TaxID=143900 RepID=A0AAD7SCN5_9TELE|nr:hypothetical protein AAFF_G00398690 [Aldrovandia affinis]
MLPHALLLLCLLLASASTSPVRRDTVTSTGKVKDLDIYSFHIKSTVSSRYAMTVITSRVANRANESREVLFHVELPKNAFISKFSMTMDGQVYNGVVKKKEEAQTQYHQAVSRGQSAGLVSAVGRTLEQFQTSVTVAAHSKVTFELTYEELLKRRLGQYQLLIKARPTQIVKDFKIEVRVNEQQGIRFLQTQGSLIADERASAINSTVSEKEALVQFSPSKEQQQCSSCMEAGLNGDLIIIYDVNRAQSKGDIQVSQGYFVHYFAPTDLPRIPKNVVFIIDQSGSMHGQKIEQTREALLTIFKEIPEEDHFGLITFDHQVIPWKDHLLPATSDNLLAARDFVRSIRDRGSTDINSALLEGVQMLNRFRESHPQKGTASILILLTDGDPTSGVIDLRKIQANVKEAIGRKYTLYCLGFGFDVNYEFLEKMALENEGVARRIYSDSDAALQLRGFYEEVATPLLLDVQLNYTGVSNLTQTRFAQYYNGSEIVVCGQVTDNNLEGFTAEVKANTKREEVVFRTAVEEKGMSEMLTLYIFEMYIQRLWAYLTVQQQLEKTLLLTGDEHARMKEQALALALKYSFVTPLTSMVVTKPAGEEQVSHKPKEGEDPANKGFQTMRHGSGVMLGHGSGVMLVHGYPGGYPASPMRPPVFHQLPGIGLDHLDQDSAYDMDYDMGPATRPSHGPGPRPSHGPAPRPTHGPATRPSHGHVDAPTHMPTQVVPKHQSVRFLLPGSNPPCYDLNVEGDPIFVLLEDAGVSITAQVKGAGFSTIAIHLGQDRHMMVNTTDISLGTDLYSWSQLPDSVQYHSVLVHGYGRELKVTLGGIIFHTVLYQQDGDHFLWPDINQSLPGSNVTGLMGRLHTQYNLTQTAAPSTDLTILGQVVTASRASAVDYRLFSMPTVDCWLFQYQSVLQGELSDFKVHKL